MPLMPNTEDRVEHQTTRHEKIRFRRGEITDLSSFPSAALEPRPARNWLPKRSLKVLLWVAGSAASLVLLLVLGLYAIGLFGIGSERLRLAAEAAMKQVAGVDVDVAMGPASIGLDGIRFLGLEVEDVTLSRSGAGEIAKAGTVRFGVRLLPLLSGDVRVSSASISDARIVVDALQTGKRIDWMTAIKNEQGLVDPDLVVRTIFSAAHHALDAVGAKAVRRIALDDVELVLPAGDGVGSVRLAQARLRETRGDSLALAATMEIGSRPVEVELTAARDDARRISALDVKVATPAQEEGEATASRLGGLDLKLTGAEGQSGEPGGINASVKLTEWAADLGPRGILSGSIDFSGRITGGSGRVEIGRLQAAIGRSLLDFRGAVGPSPATGVAGDEPAYRFNLVSARSTISPDGSPEPALRAAIQIAGNYRPGAGELSADEIVVKGEGGEALGTALMRFVEGKVPGMSVAFNVHDMPVSQVKQIWPWFAARGARNWVMNNVFGGRVTEAQLQYRVEPGRFGNGVPLNANESFGTFQVRGTRFDTAGLIPAVRDATGTIDYKGNDVTISLDSGTVYLPSGRTVAASNGVLLVKNANVPPAIGALDIDVEGEAPAVLELASYDPINAMRHIDFAPDDFSGQVTGNVKADIPLQKGVDRERLNWLVSLNYKNLAISKPVDGQAVSDAEGTIAIQKTNAVIAARVKLNGIPAEIDAVEPLGASDVERRRLITVSLDDKAREAVVPGLGNMLEGPVKVTFDARMPGKRLVKADLTKAQLSLPWVGWSKGPGIAGNVSFQLETADGKSTLSDFELSGATFGFKGGLSLAGGALTEAKFSSVRLNRNDDVALTVKQSGKGYAVDLSGKSLDARSVIKQFTESTRGTQKEAAARAVPVSLTVAVDSLTGFNDEKLSGFKMQYKGAGPRVDRMDVTATTRSGSPVELGNNLKDGRRVMRLTSKDAGAILRFLDIYARMEGGSIDLSLKGSGDGALSGELLASNFVIVNEPRLGSIVSTTPPGGDRSLNQAVRRDIDTSRVSFERLFSEIEKGDGYLQLANGVLRGQLVGASFQGTLYDPKGNIDMTGTFMPAYGLNRIFGEIPIVGILLGNGRDRGLIGVTFRLTGKSDSPTVQINPLSVIAPGIFRSIFEFR